MTAAEVAAHLHGHVLGDASIQLRGFAPADTAKPGDLTFAENQDYFARAEQSAASAILVDGNHTSSTKVLIQVAKARVAFARVLSLFYPPAQFAPGIHPTAVIDSSSQIDPSAHIGPHCVVGARARIAAKSVLESGNHIGADCLIGEGARLSPNVVLYAGTELGNRVSIHAGTVVGA